MAHREDRRETLKIIGAIGSTCAFPFSAHELYGQHEHTHTTEAAKLPEPKFFTADEFAVVSRLADLIIPRTETPGALDAQAPAYIDFVVSNNKSAQGLYRRGLAWLDAESRKRHQSGFVGLTEAQQVAMLEPLCEAADQPAKKKQALEVSFFRAVKSMTADGFFTSREGLLKSLKYPGNSALAEFPECIHEH